MEKEARAIFRADYEARVAAGEIPLGDGGQPQSFERWMADAHGILVADNHGWDDARTSRPRRHRLVRLADEL